MHRVEAVGQLGCRKLYDVIYMCATASTYNQSVLRLIYDTPYDGENVVGADDIARGAAQPTVRGGRVDSVYCRLNTNLTVRKSIRPG